MDRKASNRLAIKLIVFLMMLISAFIWGTRMTGESKDGFTVPYELLENGSSASAKVESCVAKKIFVSGSGSTTRRGKYKKTIYAPQAVTPTGEIAIGSYAQGWHGDAWCKAQIGETVQVRLHNTKPELNRISSLTQLWYPFAQVLLALFWIVIACHIRPLAWAVFGANLFVVTILFKSVGMF